MFVKTMVEEAVRGEPVRFEAGGPYPRAYTHIDDLATLMTAILDAADDADRVFFGASGGSLTAAAEVAAIVRELVPGARIEIGDRLGEADRYELNIRAPLSVADARSQLASSPRCLDIRDGVAQYIEACAFLASATAGPAAAEAGPGT